MNRPTVSERFDVEDIRKIREYNSLRHVKMTPAEIVEDTKKGAAELLARLKKNKYILLSICAICAALLLAFFVNILFKIRIDSILRAEWTAGDALNYVAAMTGAISTFVLSLIAYKKNEKLQQMEDNNYIAANSCMILINQVYVKIILVKATDLIFHL